MLEAVYDKDTQFYLDFVDRQLARDDADWPRLAGRVVALLGTALAGVDVLDVACGEGYLARALAAHGARSVTGIDISSAILRAATTRTSGKAVSYLLDDAQTLTTLAGSSFDVAVSQMAIMDIPDHAAMFRAVIRVLRPGGTFIFSMLHPCFESPFHLPEEPPVLVDAKGTAEAVVVRRYLAEGHWRLGGEGVRGRMGAYHRTLSSLVNDLVVTGFVIRGIEEPAFSTVSANVQVPRHLIVVAAKPADSAAD